MQSIPWRLRCGRAPLLRALGRTGRCASVCVLLRVASPTTTFSLPLQVVRAVWACIQSLQTQPGGAAGALAGAQPTAAPSALPAAPAPAPVQAPVVAAAAPIDEVVSAEQKAATSVQQARSEEAAAAAAKKEVAEDVARLKA